MPPMLLGVLFRHFGYSSSANWFNEAEMIGRGCISFPQNSFWLTVFQKDGRKKAESINYTHRPYYLTCLENRLQTNEQNNHSARRVFFCCPLPLTAIAPKYQTWQIRALSSILFKTKTTPEWHIMMPPIAQLKRQRFLNPGGNLQTIWGAPSVLYLTSLPHIVFIYYKKI